MFAKAGVEYLHAKINSCQISALSVLSNCDWQSARSNVFSSDGHCDGQGRFPLGGESNNELRSRKWRYGETMLKTRKWIVGEGSPENWQKNGHQKVVFAW